MKFFNWGRILQNDENFSLKCFHKPGVVTPPNIVALQNQINSVNWNPAKTKFQKILPRSRFLGFDYSRIVAGLCSVIARVMQTLKWHSGNPVIYHFVVEFSVAVTLSRLTTRQGRCRGRTCIDVWWGGVRWRSRASTWAISVRVRRIVIHHRITFREKWFRVSFDSTLSLPLAPTTAN